MLTRQPLWKISTYTDWITRQNIAHPQLSQPQALVQIFNSNTYQHQKISDVVYLNDGSLLVLTIKEKRATHQLTLVEAKPAITKILIQQKSKQFAKAKALVALKALQAKQSLSLKWQEPLTISLAAQQEFPIQGIRRIFATPVKKLPAYVGFESNQGDYWLVRINATKNQSATFGQAEIEQFATQLEETLSLSQKIAVQSLYAKGLLALPLIRRPKPARLSLPLFCGQYVRQLIVKSMSQLRQY